jgi:serine/threonine protein kinase
MQKKYDLRYRILVGELDGEEIARASKFVTDNYTKIEHVLGKGGYGCVFQLSHKDAPLAMKVQMMEIEDWPFTAEIVDTMNTAALNRMDTVGAVEQGRPRICGGFVRMYDAFSSRSLLSILEKEKTFRTEHDRNAVSALLRQHIKSDKGYIMRKAHFAVFEKLDTTLAGELKKRFRVVDGRCMASTCRRLLEFLRATLFQIFYSLFAAHRMCSFVHGDLKGDNIMFKRVASDADNRMWTFDCGADGLFCVPPDAADHMVAKIIDMGMSRLNCAYEADDARCEAALAKLMRGCDVRSLVLAQQDGAHTEYRYSITKVPSILHKVPSKHIQDVSNYIRTKMPNGRLFAAGFDIKRASDFLFLQPCPGMDTSLFARYFLHYHGAPIQTIYKQAKAAVAADTSFEITDDEKNIWNEVLQTCIDLRAFLKKCTPDLSEHKFAADDDTLWRFNMKGSAHNIVYPKITKEETRAKLLAVDPAQILSERFFAKYKTNRSELRDEMIDKTMWFVVPNDGRGLPYSEWRALPDWTAQGLAHVIKSS